MPLIELAFSAPPFDLPGIDAQFVEDVAYDVYDLTKFDIFIPYSSSLTGLVIYIHGGGFIGGNKNSFYGGANFPDDIREFLSNDIAVATINYRLLTENETEGVLKLLNDSKSALQYIRYANKELNIDKNNIVLYGSSAGAGTALWLASNDDMQDIGHSDPVLRESTRVKGLALNATQASYDIENRWINDVFVDFSILWVNTIEISGEERQFQFYGVDSWAEYESPEIDEYRQQVDMLSFLSIDDPELWIRNTAISNGMPMTQGDLNHHPFHAREVKEYADAVGVTNVCQYGNPILYSNSNFEDYVIFLTKKFKE